MLLAFPERKRIGAMLFVLATAIAVTTVYGRYHFAVDGLAGLLASVIAAAISAGFLRLGLLLPRMQDQKALYQ